MNIRPACGMLLAATLLFGCATIDTSQPSNGDITSGEHFGVTIGDDAAKARSKLEAKGMSFSGSSPCRSIDGRSCDGAQTTELYLRPVGSAAYMVVLLVKDGKVHRLMWEYPASADF